jgi:hypothetical protein
MKFYRSLVGDRYVWGKRKDEAAKLDKNYVTVEVDTSQDGLIERFQKYEDRIAQLDRFAMSVKVQEIGPDRDEFRPEPEAAPPPPTPPIAPPVEDEVFDDAPTFSPSILQTQVELLGENPNRGFDQLEEFQEIQGVSAGFSRGVHLLNIIAAGEHQLARVFLRRKKK